MLGVRIMERYRDVILAVDVMKVNKVPFLITNSQHIKFETVQLLQNMVGCTMIDGLKKPMHYMLSVAFKLQKFMPMDSLRC